MIIYLWDSSEMKEAKTNYNTYNKLVSKIEDTLSEIESAMEVAEYGLGVEKQCMDANDDSAEGKFKIIYDGITNRHIYRMNEVYNHLSEALSALRTRKEAFESSRYNWKQKVDSLNS